MYTPYLPGVMVRNLSPFRTASRRVLVPLIALVAACLTLPGLQPRAEADLAESVGRIDEPGHRRVVFPVIGGASYSNDWHAARSGGRLHLGNDLLAGKHTEVVAATDGVISFVRVADEGLSGRMVTVKDAEGWSYRYIHLNNDTPGTDDGAAHRGHTLMPGIDVGARVQQGQVLGWLGDSGNAEGTSPHLHFEIVTPEGQNMNPFASLQLAQGKRVGNLCRFNDNPPATPSVASGPGYRSLDVNGGVFTFGDVGYYGSVPQLIGQGLVRAGVRAVALEPTPSGKGYWLVDDRGGVFTFGDATFFGSLPQLQAQGLVPGAGRAVAVEATRVGMGYWLIDEFGGVYSFGDAGYFGSLPELRAAGRVAGAPRAVAIESTPSGKGYWVVDVNGGVYAFGDAGYAGSVTELRAAGAIGPAPSPIVGLAVTKSGRGYWLVDKVGGLYTFGDAGYHGSMLGTGLCQWAEPVGIAPTATGAGYWVQLADGRTFGFGDARYLGGIDVAAPGVRAAGIASSS